MTADHKPQLATLAGVCRRLAAARERVAELEAQRDALIHALRLKGVSGAAIATHTGLSAGRVTQIVQSSDGRAPTAKPGSSSTGRGSRSRA